MGLISTYTQHGGTEGTEDTEKGERGIRRAVNGLPILCDCVVNRSSKPTLFSSPSSFSLRVLCALRASVLGFAYV